MVTLIGLVRTILALNQPFEGLPYENRKLIRFRNGWQLNITFSQFRFLRDSYKQLKKYPLKQVNENLFEVDFGNFKITRDADIISAIANLLNSYNITQLDKDIFLIKGDSFELEGTSYMLMVFEEQLKGAGRYNENFRGKVVLDIGAFQGETAILFFLAGAKKVLAYEPMPENFRFLNKNMQLNHVNVKIFQEGIGTEDTEVTVTEQFGQLETSTTQKQINLKISNITNILRSSDAEIAKIDCEGAEICLVSVPDDILRLIPCYFIELHGRNVREAVTKKLLNAGFKIARILEANPNLATIKFIRKN